MYWMKQAQISKYHQVPNYMISDSKPPNLEGVFFNNNKKTPLIGSITNKKPSKVSADQNMSTHWKSIQYLFVIRCAIWYQLYSLKHVKNTHGGALLLVKLQAWNFTKSNTPPWAFSTFFKLYELYQIKQRISFYSSEERME